MSLILQELFASPYFCQEQSEEHFKLAQASTSHSMGTLSKELVVASEGCEN